MRHARCWRDWSAAVCSSDLVFATDPSTVFSPGTVCTLTANFADGTTASATVTVPVIPTITSVTPSTGAPGTSPTVTVARSEERRVGKEGRARGRTGE